MKKLLCALMLILAMVLTACGQSAKTPEAGKDSKSISQDKEITIAGDSIITTMDPMDTPDTLSGGLQRMVMDGLFAFDDNMKIYPMLASGYKANENATVYTITLRQGIKFSDGTAWNADAALANVAKWADKSLKLRRTSFLSSVLKSWKKVDNYTIEITLNKPFGAFLNNLAHPACLIMSPKQIAAGKDACAKKPIGTGQYTFVEWIPGDHMKLALNKNWWGYDDKLAGGKALAQKDAGFKSITYKRVAEDATRVAMLQSGDAQVIWPIPTESMKSLEGDKKVKVFKEDGNVVRYFMMNNQKKPFSDPKVRRAISMGIDKDAYVKVVRNGMGAAAKSVIGPKVQFYKANDVVKYDPEGAKKLLAEAGYPKGFKTTLMFTINTANQKAAEFFKQQLAQIGIDLELKGNESAITVQRVIGAKGAGSEVDVETYINSWSCSTADADWGIRPLLAKESEPPLSYNISYYENPDLEKYILQGLGSADAKVRKEAYDKAQDLIWKDIPMIALANDLNSWGINAKLSNVKLFADGAINMKNAKMAQ